MKDRNITLDIFKVLLSIMVVCIHFPPLFEKGSMLTWYFSNHGITELAVPCFFIINGFFFAKNVDNSAKFKKYIYRVCIMYAIWAIIYLPLYYEIAPIKYVILFLLEGYIHLWYIVSLIWGIILLHYINHKTDNIILTLLIAILSFAILTYLSHLNSGYKSLTLFIDFIQKVSCGFFFVTLGSFVYQKMKNINITRSKLSLLWIISLTLFLIAIHPSLQYTMKEGVKFLLLPLASALTFLLVMRFSSYKPAKGLVKYISNISAGIYFSHIYIVNRFYPCFEENYNIFQLPIVIGICIIISVFLILLNRKVKYLL